MSRARLARSQHPGFPMRLRRAFFLMSSALLLLAALAAAPGAHAQEGPITPKPSEVSPAPSAAPAGADAPSPAAPPAATAPSEKSAPEEITLAENEKAEAAKHEHLDAFQMFRAADPVVKSVMIVLAVASVAAWAILFVMWTRIGLRLRNVKRSLRLLSSVDTFSDERLNEVEGDASCLIGATREEIMKSGGILSEAAIDRARGSMMQVEIAAGRNIATGLGILASIGSTGPFVGLFGTVWGIMHSFVSIANTGTTNLSVVAPGIAEALLATAIGLVAAIPAVIFYNLLTRRGSYYRSLLGEGSVIIVRHLSRDLEHAPARARAA